MRRPDRPEKDGRAIRASQHDSHRRRVVAQGADRSRRAAGVALNLSGRDIGREDLAKSARGGVAVQDETQIVIRDYAGPPLGPNRSVLIMEASWPSSTRKLETSSTKGVGPQT